MIEPTMTKSGFRTAFPDWVRGHPGVDLSPDNSREVGGHSYIPCWSSVWHGPLPQSVDLARFSQLTCRSCFCFIRPSLTGSRSLE